VKKQNIFKRTFLYFQIYYKFNIPNKKMLLFFSFFFFLSLLKSSDISTQAVCGNGIREAGEECDDGNTNNFDGCSQNCTVELNYLCIKDPEGTEDICFQNNPLTAELNYIPHTSPPQLEFLFSRPIIYSDLYTFSKTMYIQIGQSFNGSVFTWTLEENDSYIHANQSFLITITFAESFLRQTLTLTFLDPYSFKDLFGKTLSSSSCILTADLPSHVIFSEASIEFISFMKGCIVSLMIVMLILCLPLSIMDSLGIFWNLFDSCQLFQLLILVSCDYPDPIKDFFEGFSITNFRLIEYFNENLDSGKRYQESPDLPYWISDKSYSTMFMANAFYSLLFLGLFVIIFLILEILSRFHLNPGSYPMRLKNLFGYSMVLRTTLITYTPFALATMLQLLNFRFSGWTNSINSVLALLWVFYLVILPLIYLKLLNHKEVVSEDEGFRTKIRPLIELLNIKAILKRNFQIFYTIRKFLWVVFIISLGDDVLGQIFGVIFVQVCILTLFILKKPYSDKLVNYMLLITEILLLITLFLISVLICFDYLNSDMNLNVRVGISWGIVGFLSAIVFMKMCFMIIEIVKNLRYLIPKAKRMFRKFDDDDDNFIEMGDYNLKGTEGNLKSLSMMESSVEKSQKLGKGN